MRDLVILGAGTAGTMVANRLRRRLPRREWRITVVDHEVAHLYQPGLLFVPFGGGKAQKLVKPRRRSLDSGVDFVVGDVDRIEPAARLVHLADGHRLDYDFLVIASGTQPRPDQTPGMLGDLWRKSIHEFYTYDGAIALREALEGFARTGGRLVVHIVDMPIKCPVAPLEFAFLADAHLRALGIRDEVEITYVTPLPDAFTKPVAAATLGSMLTDRKILLETDFLVEHIDGEARELVSYDERRIPFDLLVTVPLNMGADFVARSGLGDELNYVPVDRHTLRSKAYDTIFAIGDAADLPTSKAGSVAHFAADVFVANFVRLARGDPMTESFDGHANCFVEAGDDKALLIDFNYDTEPLPGTYPLPAVGPLRLLRATRLNHWGKLAFAWLYWHVLLPGRPLPLPAEMSMAGKRRPKEE
ncbi:MAG: NAD(P)/FAD-dependent oxidoreductase [Hamadaea sp.]|uniref:type III sulfide quinone reductase, selenoprotein subtype n=1 Tax=Hamadaea sp. TaxID=2024425 RepID=UPI00178EF87B|nr:FAD/NAD(P)-binding oxidoreductase [Hamadaea sp.]NUT18913.1 NAD(P)/FAD-dependent oxidoreductase [Hamadaea sp.]